LYNVSLNCITESNVHDTKGNPHFSNPIEDKLIAKPSAQQPEDLLKRYPKDTDIVKFLL